MTAERQARRSSQSVFRGRVDSAGKFIADDQEGLKRRVRSFTGKPAEVVVRARTSQRSADQNAWLWGVAIPRLAEALGYEPHEREHHEAIHYALVLKRFGKHFDERLGEDVPNARSSKLTTVQFSDYMEWLVRHAAIEHGCYIPLPDEVDWSEVDVPDHEAA